LIFAVEDPVHEPVARRARPPFALLAGAGVAASSVLVVVAVVVVSVVSVASVAVVVVPPRSSPAGSSAPWRAKATDGTSRPVQRARVVAMVRVVDIVVSDPGGQ
jgi:hypothetical protein